MPASSPAVTPSATPKHLAVADALRRSIRSGELKPGDRLPSYSQAREMYGAHTVTLEKAHAQLEREGLIVRERGRGTFVALTSRRSTGKRPRKSSGIVGIAGFGFEFASRSSYWSQLLGGLNGAARAAGRQVMLLGHDTTEGWEKADGLILCDWSGGESLSMVPPGMPLVSIMVPVKGVASVFADDYMGGKLAAQHLIKLGHRRIAFLHTQDVAVLPRRRAGWLDALGEAGIKADAGWERTTQSQQDYGVSFAQTGRMGMMEWLEGDWDELGCTALLAHNDHTALGVIEALREAGKRVPEDVSVVGFDDTEICRYTSPRLCSVQVPLGAIGEQAMQMLLEQLSGAPKSQEHRALPVKLKARESSGSAPHSRATG